MTQPCKPSSSAFVWRVTADGRIEFTHDYSTDDPESSRWFSCGRTDNPDGAFAHVYDKAFESTPLTWRTVLGYEDRIFKEWFRNKRAHKWVEGKVQVPLDSEIFVEAVRLNDAARARTLLAVVGESTGQKLDSQKWTMLSPNAVLHPHFGPAVTVATDGQRVILFSFARFGTEFTITHREAIMGPITSTPTHVAEWNYYRNSSAATQASEASKLAKRVAGAQQENKAARELLKKLNKTLGLNIQF